VDDDPEEELRKIQADSGGAILLVVLLLFLLGVAFLGVALFGPTTEIVSTTEPNAGE
jgi:hypothetical protein